MDLTYSARVAVHAGARLDADRHDGARERQREHRQHHGRHRLAHAERRRVDLRSAVGAAGGTIAKNTDGQRDVHLHDRELQARSPGTATRAGRSTAGNPYDFPTATSASVLGVPTATGTNVVQWFATRRTPTRRPSRRSVSVPGTSPGIFALEGGTAIVASATTSPPTRGRTLTNACPPTDGYRRRARLRRRRLRQRLRLRVAGRGDQRFLPLQAEQRHDRARGPRWRPTPWNVGAGGALTTLGGLIYALEGGNTDRLRARTTRAAIRGRRWPTCSPADRAKAAARWRPTAPTSMRLRGNGKNNFYRYNVAANTWSRDGQRALGVAEGGAMTAIGTTLYALAGQQQERLSPSSSPMRPPGHGRNSPTLPGNVEGGRRPHHRWHDDLGDAGQQHEGVLLVQRRHEHVVDQGRDTAVERQCRRRAGVDPGEARPRR